MATISWWSRLIFLMSNRLANSSEGWPSVALHRVLSLGSLAYPEWHSHLNVPFSFIHIWEQDPGSKHSSTSEQRNFKLERRPIGAVGSGLWMSTFCVGGHGFDFYNWNTYNVFQYLGVFYVLIGIISYLLSLNEQFLFKYNQNLRNGSNDFHEIKFHEH